MSGHAKLAVQIQSESELFTGDTYKLSLGLAGSLPYACFLQRIFLQISEEDFYNLRLHMSRN